MARLGNRTHSLDMNKAASLNKAVILLWYTTALLPPPRPDCIFGRDYYQVRIVYVPPLILTLLYSSITLSGNISNILLQ